MSQYYELKSRAEASVKRILKDPDVAEFRGFFPGEIDGLSVGCGEVNARNSLGGYTGFKRYVSAGGESVQLEGETPEFSQVWSAICQPYISRQ